MEGDGTSSDSAHVKTDVKTARSKSLKLPSHQDVGIEYHYSPLSQSANIRLLLLLPCKGDSKIVRCRLLETALRTSDNPRPYEALSYCWGSDEKTQSIVIVDDQENGENNNQELKITQNLYTALVRLQDRDIPRVIWVDAICINQSHNAEKEVQIQLMAEIYAKASRVVVWLGGSQDGSDDALMEICESAQDLTISRPPTQEIEALLERPWFRRIWVRE
jgi:hypothetical protein